MRQSQKVSFQDRVQQNIELIMKDHKLMEQIDERIDQRHHERIKKIPS
ncbi:FbpB family small basic protein [Halobacillus massiliensis]|nr:FbpB family small basic protein [Halobacillus massiliensis]